MSVDNLASVIVPAYNREKHLEATVNSVYSNTYRPIELIIVDDGSSDKTYQVANQLKDKLEDETFIVKLIRQENKGAPSARNNGLDNSEGDYILFLDSDDEIPSSKLSSQIAMLEDTGADACVSDFTINYLTGDKSELVYGDNNQPLRKVVFHKSIGCSTAVLRSELAKSVRWYEPLPNFQDMDYFLNVLLMSKKIVHLPESLYIYYRYSTGTISSNTKNKRVPFFKRVKSMFSNSISNFSYSSTPLHRIYGVVSLFYLFVLWGKYAVLNTVRKT